MILELIATILSLVGSWMVYKKMGRQGWEGIVPIYNTYVLCQELYGNGWKFLLLLIPFYNIYFGIKMMIDLAKAFNLGAGFGIGLLLLSAFQMTLLLVLRFQADEILILLLPLLLCGIICLVCKKHTFLWIGWVISLFLALSPYYFFWIHVNYFSWIAVFIWAFVTVGYIIWQGTAEKRRRERY